MQFTHENNQKHSVTAEDGLEDSNTWATGGDGAIFPDVRPQPFSIGGNMFDKSLVWPKYRQFYGTIDEVRVANKALEFKPIPKRSSSVPLPHAGVTYLGTSNGWNTGVNESVLWQEDPVSYPGVAGCYIFDGTDIYNVADAETAGLISGTLYTFDGPSQTYKSIPGTGGDYIYGDKGYVIWSFQPNLELLIPLQ